MTDDTKMEFELPIPNTFERIVKLDFNLREIWSYIRLTFLYQKLLGYNKNIRASIINKEPKALALIEDVERLKNQIIDENLMQVKAVYQFFKCHAINNEIFIDFNGKEVVLNFPRQENDPFLCLSDYVAKSNDTIGFLVVTAGHEILDYAKKIELEGSYKDAFILQGLAIATSEALAEMIHHQMRIMWGLEEKVERSYDAGPPRKYLGNRYSFGYPSCPNMEDQEVIWQILQPEEIEVTLTESYMMIPEASVSAIVFHHPNAKYFNI
ncbi:MAG: hypothetical protein OEZ01_04680 [Candidatus Heimdallarchaeota archaeon]|nr:hypothetical protein [Candidatus Heimdallarchaeota archaeon]MDH5645276.1 hypothetical protein [Candidatus Heimdallarchaeota archaeon]